MYQFASGVDAARDAGQPEVPARKAPENKLPILVIESKSLLREALTSLLAQTRFWVVGSGPTLDAIPHTTEETPVFILIGAHDVAAVTAILEKCSARYPAARRVVLHECGVDQLVQILKAGAHACLGHTATKKALLMALDAAMQGVTVLSSHLGFVESEHFGPHLHSENEKEDRQGHSAEIEASHKLSPREIAILDCLVHGDSNKAIARKFEIAEATVKVHIKAILRKLSAANRTQAAIWAIHNLARVGDGARRE